MIAAEPININFAIGRDRYEYCQVDCLTEKICSECNSYGKQRWLLCGMAKGISESHTRLFFARTILSEKRSTN